jgi:hypothetical protein
MALVAVGSIKDGTCWHRNLVEDVSHEIRAHAQMIPRETLDPISKSDVGEPSVILLLGGNVWDLWE